MTKTAHAQHNPMTAYRLAGAAAAMVWGAFVIGCPLGVALLLHVPAGHYGIAAGCVVLASIMGTPWFVFGLPVVRRLVHDL